MSVTLVSEAGESLPLSTIDWSDCLELAAAHGWQARGAFAGDGARVDYTTNDGQYVCREDASALAEAFSSALGPGGTLAHESTGAVRALVRALADFCAAGAFLVL